MAPFVHHKDDH
jgi:uncharacterized protein (UPF0335 family)